MGTLAENGLFPTHRRVGVRPVRAALALGTASLHPGRTNLG